ncbi:MAG: TAXI family TRAP transporter solute-binding subunit [Paracoccaceae bacterium]
MRTWAIIFVLVVLGAIAVIAARLHPPLTLSMAAGPKDGGYYQIALKYKAILERDGITLEIIETAGSAENMQLLERREASAALVQGGVLTDDDEIEAIASIFFEPLIPLVHVDSVLPGNPSEWRDLRISSGTAGSGTNAAFQDLQKSVRLAGNANDVFHYGYREALDRLLAQDIDIALFVAPVEAPYLEDAFWEPDLRMLELDYVNAISRRLNYADVVTVPAGAISLHRVIPKTDMTLLALDARLAIDPDLHPALVNRVTMAAMELHSGRGLIHNEGRFPSVYGTELPVNNAARQLILEGPSTWHDWLPYWLAAQINRMLLLLLPIFLIVVPALRALPALYSYIMGWRVWQHYPSIREIEDELDTQSDETDLQKMDDRLAALDAQLSQMRLPAAYRQGAYDARLHIELVRKKIGERLQHSAGN